MRKKTGQIVGDRLKPALSAADQAFLEAFLKDEELAVGSGVSSEALAWPPIESVHVRGAALKVGLDPPPRLLPRGQSRGPNREVVGNRQKPAPSAANVTFVTDGGLRAGSTVAQKTFPVPFEGTPVTGPALKAGPDPPRPLPTVPRREFNVTSPAPRGSGAIRDRHEVVGDQQKSAPSIADETFLTDEELAARWQVAAKTLRNARVAGRLIGFVKIGRSVRYRLSEIIAYERKTQCGRQAEARNDLAARIVAGPNVTIGTPSGIEIFFSLPPL
jgi:hypothetical protein